MASALWEALPRQIADYPREAFAALEEIVTESQRLGRYE